ncbi:D-mannonate oxidoreductase [Thalassospira profundimaris]|uniref:D-mannonate oxidoreductase n=1 Tax=Thalassospira profundimaris TaxID=502049 RepID=A0A367WJA9_9PROT|nr:mannitol dehydrogenase family protein [Thalassospira profundimaris]RCK41507.1 D-mannonate oxidoreductase [Thalassospira profundimaris]
MSAKSPTPILQFGTSRFLQAHFDLFVDEALKNDQAIGPITVVQSSGASARSGRLAALAAEDGYPVKIRGLENGSIVDREQQIVSITRALSTATDWPKIVAIFVNEVEYLVSNTADAGYAPQPADKGDAFDQAMSFPAKLRLLLKERFLAHGRPLTIMPMELIPENGAVLRACVLALAEQDDSDFQDWLQNRIIWVNSLVDRIVSEPIDPAGAICEPYALWAIENQPGLALPCQHSAIELVDTLDDIEALKLFILNLGHTWLADRWQQQGSDRAMSVKTFLEDSETLNALQGMYEAEVIPGFAAAGMEQRARTYLATTIDRFRNPFLDHKLADIAQNHRQKIERRIRGFVDWAQSHGDTTPKPALAALINKVPAP